MEEKLIQKVEERLVQLEHFYEALDGTPSTDDFHEKIKALFAKEEYVYMANEVTHLINFLKEMGVDFSENDKIQDFYNKVKDKSYKRKFVAVDGKIEEVVKGTVENRIKELTESGVIEQVKNMLEQAN